MRWALTTLILLVAALAASPARAQDVLEDARLGPVRERLDAALEEARRDGFPAEWLLDKVAEGLSKRVPPVRIASAVDGLLERIRSADGLLARVPERRRAERRRLLRAAVDALSAGAPNAALGRLVDQVVEQVVEGDRGRASARVYEALTTVAELAERQFSGAAAVEATAHAYRGGLEPRELLRRARRIGHDPPGGRDRALREVGQGRGPPEHAGTPGRGVGRGAPNPGRGSPGVGNPGRGRP